MCVRVLVSRLSGESRGFRMSPNETISDLKFLIRKAGVRSLSRDMQLLLNSRSLPDEWTLRNGHTDELHLAIVLAPKTCAECGLQTKCKRCSRCEAVAYCSTRCQQAHWLSQHRQECTQLQPHASLVDVLCYDGSCVKIAADIAMTVGELRHKVAKEQLLIHLEKCVMIVNPTTDQLMDENMRIAELPLFRSGSVVTLNMYLRLTRTVALLSCVANTCPSSSRSCTQTRKRARSWPSFQKGRQGSLILEHGYCLG